MRGLKKGVLVWEEKFVVELKVCRDIFFILMTESSPKKRKLPKAFLFSIKQNLILPMFCYAEGRDRSCKFRVEGDNHEWQWTRIKFKSGIILCFVFLSLLTFT